MAKETAKKISVSFRLNNGTDSEGAIKTIGLNLGTLSVANYDDAKMLAIKELLAPCLSKTIYSTEKTTVSVVTA